MFYCQCGYVVGNLILKRPVQFGCYFQCLCIFFYTPLAGTNISYAPTCTQATDKRDPPAVSELVANHADSLQLQIRAVLLTRRFGDQNRSEWNSSCLALAQVCRRIHDDTFGASAPNAEVEMKGKIDQNASRLDSLIKERFYLVDEVKVFKQQAELMVLPFKSFITPSRPKVKEWG